MSKQESHKNILQEYCQLHNLQLPVYDTKHVSGPAHKPCFQSTCRVMFTDIDEVMIDGQGTEPSKKLAEQNAAQQMLMYIADNVNNCDCDSDSDCWPSVSTVDELAPYIYQCHGTVILWDVENYKLTKDLLYDLGSCLIIAIDSEGSKLFDKVDKDCIIRNDSELVHIRAPTRLHDGSDVAIIWILSYLETMVHFGHYIDETCTELGECKYHMKCHVKILSNDKIFCTVCDIVNQWSTKVESIVLL